jgi:hypothetical protein
LPPTLINDLDVIVLLDENRTAFRKAQNPEKGKTGLIDIPKPCSAAENKERVSLVTIAS